MKKLALIAAIALVTVISTSQPSPADPAQCLVCNLGYTSCYVRFTWDCVGPKGVYECNPAQYQQCLGG